MNLKIGGNNVGKIMYNGQEFGGGHKSGDAVYVASLPFSGGELETSNDFVAKETDNFIATVLVPGSSSSTREQVSYSQLINGFKLSIYPFSFKNENGKLTLYEHPAKFLLTLKLV